MLETFLITLEALGVLAFALSGIMEAARKQFDLVADVSGNDLGAVD